MGKKKGESKKEKARQRKLGRNRHHLEKNQGRGDNRGGHVWVSKKQHDGWHRVFMRADYGYDAYGVARMLNRYIDRKDIEVRVRYKPTSIARREELRDKKEKIKNRYLLTPSAIDPQRWRDFLSEVNVSGGFDLDGAVCICNIYICTNKELYIHRKTKRRS